MIMSKKIILNDLVIRCQNLRKQFPDNPKCALCENPVDVTLLGPDTTCPYHRLLHDHWMYEEDGDEFSQQVIEGKLSREDYRAKFQKWMNSLTKDERDEIVLEAANDGINWVC